jgi:hypothetical protein
MPGASRRGNGLTLRGRIPHPRRPPGMLPEAESWQLWAMALSFLCVALVRVLQLLRLRRSERGDLAVEAASVRRGQVERPADRAVLAGLSRLVSKAGRGRFFVQRETLLRWHRDLVPPMDVSSAAPFGTPGSVGGLGPAGTAVGRGEPHLGLSQDPWPVGHHGRRSSHPRARGRSCAARESTPLRNAAHWAFSCERVSPERFVGPARRACLDRMLVFHRRQLETVRSEFVDYYNEHRPHRPLWPARTAWSEQDTAADQRSGSSSTTTE